MFYRLTPRLDIGEHNTLLYNLKQSIRLNTCFYIFINVFILYNNILPKPTKI